MSTDIGETRADDAAGLHGLPHPITIPRKIFAIVLGVIYNVSFAGGISEGFDAASESVNWLAQSPIAVVFFLGVSFTLTGFLTAHSARSLIIGVITGVAVSAIYPLSQGKLWEFLFFFAYESCGSGFW